jgi:hypothetical protein
VFCSTQCPGVMSIALAVGTSLHGPSPACAVYVRGGSSSRCSHQSADLSFNPKLIKIYNSNPSTRKITWEMIAVLSLLET